MLATEELQINQKKTSKRGGQEEFSWKHTQPRGSKTLCMRYCGKNKIKHCVCATAAAAKSLQSCPTLCEPVDSSPPGSPVPGIIQARTLAWVAISFSNAWKWKGKVKSLSCFRLLATPMDRSLPGSSVHGIFQARALEWGAVAFSRKGLGERRI